MKIRCGSHQQNRSIVRPGLSLMATKVALTAEEFRENSQRSIDLFNTEKLSTDSTHVLKSAYAFCAFLPLQSVRGVWRQRRSSACACSGTIGCNLYGACGGKGDLLCKVAQPSSCNLYGACGGKAVDGIQKNLRRRCNLYGACGGKASSSSLSATCPMVAICTGRVEAKSSWRT